jgi:hypothetical protein
VFLPPPRLQCRSIRAEEGSVPRCFSPKLRPFRRQAGPHVVPSGGQGHGPEPRRDVHWPKSLVPQPTTDPSRSNAAMCRPPTAISTASVTAAGSPHMSVPTRTRCRWRPGRAVCPPAATETQFDRSAGTDVCPSSDRPQAATDPFDSSAMECASPPQTAATPARPGGTVVCPSLFAPHARTVPSSSAASECNAPAPRATARMESDGGNVCPSSKGASAPQAARPAGGAGGDRLMVTGIRTGPFRESSRVGQIVPW